MKVLLDTHVLLWALYDSSRLSPAAKEAILILPFRLIPFELIATPPDTASALL